MERLLFISGVCISTMLVFCYCVSADCNSVSGPSGITECIQISRYNNMFQWGTCVTDVYMKAKSNNKWHCEDRSAIYCYYQCMGEVYYKNSGPVSPDCSCSDGEKHNESNLTLPARCYSPSGTDCTWYQDCLAEKYKCSESKDDYAMNFATKFCNLYSEHYEKFSTGGKTWINAVRKCLQVKLVPIVRPWRSLTCKEIKELAFQSHVPCYVRPDEKNPGISICNLGPSDFFSVFWTVKSSLVMSVDSSLETINGFWKTIKQCAFFKSYSFDGDIRNIQIAVEHEGFQVIRRRRSVPKDSIRLSNDLVGHIAKHLNWDKKGIVWFSYENNSTNGAPKTMLIDIFLADRRTYDLNAENASKSDLNATIADFQTKVQTGDLFGDTKDVSFKVISSQGCSDANCDVISFNVTVNPFVTDNYGQTTQSATPSSLTFTSNGNEEKGTESQSSSNYSMTSAQRETADSFVSTKSNMDASTKDVHVKLTLTSYKEQTTHSATSSSTTLTPNGNEKKDTSNDTSVNTKNKKTYIIIGMSSAALLVIVTIVFAILCSNWKHGYGQK